MITNKIIHILISITAIVVIPVQIITTFVLGLIVSITFGLLLIPISAIWMVLFLYPLLGLSYVYEKVVFLRPFIAIVGIPLAVLGDTYVSLMPSMGEKESRYEKLILCQTFPYSWRYTQFKERKLNIGEKDLLSKILKEVSRAKPLSDYLDGLRADVYSRPEYINKKYRLDW